MADLYWNQDDPEIPYYTVEDWAAYEGIGMYTGPRTVTMQRAIRLRSITYKVTPYQPNEEWDDVEYKVEIVK